MNAVTICYLDENKNQRFVSIDDPRFFKNEIFNKAQFKADFPNLSVTAVFNEKDNLITAAEDGYVDFCYRCEDYGFMPDDYMRTFSCDGKEYCFMGFLPENTKYKAALRNITTGKRIKATIKFVKANINDTSGLKSQPAER